jgi:Flp pilus assembly protein TadG
MLAHTDPGARTGHQRGGVALLIALLAALLVAAIVVSLARGSAFSARAQVLTARSTQAAALAESAHVRALSGTHDSVWRALRQSDTRIVAERATGTHPFSSTIGRPTWSTLMARGTSRVPAGVPHAQAAADRRSIIPLWSPLSFPRAALSAPLPWLLDASAIVSVPTASLPESRCRAGILPAVEERGGPDAAFVLSALPAIDPDTVIDTVRSAVRLSGPRLARPFAVRGILAVDSDLLLEADLQIEGVLVTRGSLVPSGGHLQVTGAVVAGDVGAGASALGPGDRVQYDACALRHALDLITHPAPVSRWMRLSPW